LTASDSRKASTSLSSFEGDSTAVTWQTKSFYPPMMENDKLTMDGRLSREETRVEEVPEEGRPYYDEEIGGFERDLERLEQLLTPEEQH
jgi:hypothetical protein